MSSNQSHNPHAADAYEHHEHPPHLQHHFETPEQQFEASKLGMWLFLGTELLMFGGLFAAYSVYRSNNPEIYLYSHHFLDTSLGALNTVILLASSFTMAWGVRASQLGQQTLLRVMLALTLAGGLGFMVVKAVEYTDKFNRQLTPGTTNLFYPADDNPRFADVAEGDRVAAQREAVRELEVYYGLRAGGEDEVAEGYGGTAGSQREPVMLASLSGVAGLAERGPPERTIIPDPEESAQGMIEPVDPYAVRWEELSPNAQGRTHMFFQIYYMMTGLHGIHVLVGMGLIGWILLRSFSGVFGPAYYTPVDLVGLYWHLVDLIWIFLFPLLYLIH